MKELTQPNEILDDTVCGDATTKCAHCGHEWMHIYGVTYFRRMGGEDGESYVACSSNPHLDTHNPSLRRDGIVVSLICEGCDKITLFNIAQHKGQNLLFTQALPLGGDLPRT